MSLSVQSLKFFLHETLDDLNFASLKTILLVFLISLTIVFCASLIYNKWKTNFYMNSR